MRFYSEQTGCTYIPELHASMPTDAVVISEAVYLSVIANPAPGKIRAHVDGLPVLIDPPPATAAELAELERRWRDGELLAVTWLRDRHRDQIDIGADTTLTPDQFNALLVYMQALRDWPQSEAFPDSNHRPAAPPWIAEQPQ
ncbi:phage tail assembly chaperone [Pseudomonas sp. ES1]|uniref:phage tail assembly chaperone n=1 Tax=Pseudomonas sp. ES1 TaxID=3424775 RepID=UPI003D33A656